MDPRLRILFVLPDLSFGGSERVMLTLLGGLDRAAFAPSLAVGRLAGHFAAEVPGDAPIHELGAARARGVVVPLVRLARRIRPDVLFSSLGYLNMLVMAARPFLPRATALVGRETNIPSLNLAASPLPRFLPLLYRLLYPRFDCVVCQSQDMLRDMTESFGLPPGRAVVIPNPVDVERIQDLAGQGEDLLLPGRVRLVAAGKLKAQKGFDLLLRAMALLPADHSLTILGEGPDREALEALAQDLGLAGRVRLAGFAANPYASMARADVFVLSSRFEGFPNVVLEAMACGTPVAAFACPGGLDEIVIPGVNGRPARPGDPADLARAVARVVAEPWDRQAVACSVAGRYGAGEVCRRYGEALAGAARLRQGDRP